MRRLLCPISSLMIFRGIPPLSIADTLPWRNACIVPTGIPTCLQIGLSTSRFSVECCCALLPKPANDRSGCQRLCVERDCGLMLWNRQRMKLIRGLLLLAFQNPHDRKDCVPVARGHRRTEQLVDLAEIADCLHVPTVHSEHEPVLRRDHSHEPVSTWGKTDWDGGHDADGLRQNAHESNNISA